MASQIHIMDIGDRDSGGIFRRESVPLNSSGTVDELRFQVGEKLGKCPTQFQMTYIGKILNDGEALQTIGVNVGSTVLIYPKVEKPKPLPADPTSNKSRIVTCIKRLIKLKALHLVATTELQMQISRAMPHVDVTTLALLHNDRLLRNWVTEKTAKCLDKMAENFPYLGDVLTKACVLIELREKIEPRMAGSVYLVDALSSESEEEEESHPQLAAGPGPSRGTQGRTVTEQMLQSALQAAYTEQSQVATRTFGPQLQMMREMGLTDERACIQALVRTGGDVDMAINMLFND